jgi:hypothetical protein
MFLRGEEEVGTRRCPLSLSLAQALRKADPTALSDTGIEVEEDALPAFNIRSAITEKRRLQPNDLPTLSEEPGANIAS